MGQVRMNGWVDPQGIQLGPILVDLASKTQINREKFFLILRFDFMFKDLISFEIYYCTILMCLHELNTSKSMMIILISFR